MLLDNNFASIISAALWGRNVYASVTRFLQFQLTTNVVAVVTAVAGSLATARSPVTAVQVCWEGGGDGVSGGRVKGIEE